ncbi:MAG: DUF58 domain-containing protein [Verrucomicrobiota bacterium]
MIVDDVDRHLHRLQISTRQAVNDLLAGEYLSVFRGRGVEFDEVREYQPGDDVRSIDWNVTARTGVPHVKRFVEERELTMYFLVDMSASNRFGSDLKTKNESAVELAALLAFSAVKNNDRVGLVLFTEEVELYVAPSKGRRHVMRILRDLSTFRARHRGTNIRGALSFLNRVTTKSAVALLVSDFQADEYESEMIEAARRHDLIAAIIRDPHEQDLPPVGLVQMRDAETGDVRVLDTSSLVVREAFRESVAAHRRELHSLLEELDVDYLDLMTGADHVAELHGFFQTRLMKGMRHA